MNGELLNTFISTNDAGQDRPEEQVSIAKCCRGEMASYKDFIFIYKKEYTLDYLNIRLHRYNTRIANGKSKAILKFNINEELIDTFTSMRTCAKVDGLSRCLLKNRLLTGNPENTYTYKYA